MASLLFSGYDPYMPTDTVDDTAGMSDMQGPSSAVNQLAGQSPWWGNPSRCLLALWFVALFLYWFLGWFFRAQRG